MLTQIMANPLGADSNTRLLGKVRLSPGQVAALVLEAWASMQSVRPTDAAPGTPPDDPGTPTVDVHGENRSNATHRSMTDPEARLYRKGKGCEVKLCYMGHVVMENRHGLVVQAAARK